MRLFFTILFLVLFLPNFSFGREIGGGFSQRMRNFTCSDSKILEEGRVNLTIRLPFYVEKSDAEAANFLAQTLGEIASSGNIEVKWFGGLKKDENAAEIVFEKGAPFSISPQRLENKIFSVKADGKKISLVYPSNADAMAIVGIFLREYCGARFFAPDNVGANIPKLRDIVVKGGERIFSPSFDFYDFYLGNIKSSMWKRCVGCSSIPAFSHNMGKVLSSLGDSKNVQPDFLDARAPEIAADFIVEYLSKNPEKISAPLGIDDTQNVPEPVAKFKSGYFRDYPNYSDAVFSFTSDTANTVSKRHPSKFVGALAYLICVDSPSFRISGNIFPMICADRSNYVFDAFRMDDYSLMSRWSASGVKLWGIYDYAYGSSYGVPRTVEKFLAEAMETANALGAKAYCAEVYPIWAYDVKKLWILSRIADDSTLDVNNLESEFYESYYGGFAESVRKFFSVAENAWKGNERTKGNPAWLEFYNCESSTSLFSEDSILEMRAIIDEISGMSENMRTAKYVGKFSIRIKELELAFAVTEAAWKTYYWNRKLFTDANFSLGEIPETLRNSSKSKSSLELALSDFSGKSVYPNSFWRTGISDKSSPEDLCALEILKAGGDVTELEKSSVERARKFLSSPKINLLRGGDFERASDSKGNFPAFWNIYSQDICGLEVRIDKVAARTGKGGAKFSMCEQTGISQSFEIHRGENCLFEGWIKSDCRVGASPYATLCFYSETGEILARRTFVLPYSTDGKFARFVLSGTAPDGTVKVGAAFFAARMLRGGTVFADDFAFYIY